MKIPWPDHYRIVDKILAAFAATVVVLMWVVAFILGVYFYFFGG